MLTKEQVLNAQKQWGNGVVKIGSLKEQRVDCEKAASDFLDKYYAFDLGKILFKPTKTSVVQFRPDKERVLCYFVAGNNNFPEDHGFAITPWTKVRFDNLDQLILLLQMENIDEIYLISDFRNKFYADVLNEESKQLSNLSLQKIYKKLTAITEPNPKLFQGPSKTKILAARYLNTEMKR